MVPVISIRPVIKPVNIPRLPNSSPFILLSPPLHKLYVVVVFHSNKVTLINGPVV